MKRDDAIIETLAFYRFANSEQIHQLVGGSYRKLQARLQQLYHHGYVDRPPKQINLWTSGRSPYIYALADEGAKLLRNRGVQIVGENRPRYWHKQNLEVSGSHLHHTSLITSFAVKMKTACDEQEIESRWTREGKELQDKIDLPSGVIRRPGRKTVKLNSRRKASFNPDGMLHLKWNDGKKRRRAFVEIDTGTEPNMRQSSYGTDISTKMRVFDSWAKAGRHKDRYPEKGFIVLFATTGGEKRIENIRQTARLIDPKGIGSNMFWVAHFDQAIPPPDLLTSMWRSPNGQERSLLD